MGCDGGSIPKREELVKTKQKEERPEAAEQLKTQYSTCFLSKQKLEKPIVGCLLGKLYNKSSILNYLLDKTCFGDLSILVGHIGSLKDVTVLKLTDNPLAGIDQQSSIQSAFHEMVEASKFICPVSMKEMNGHSRFIYLLSCGCVMAEQAVKTVASESCLVCNAPCSLPDDIILINPVTDLELKLAKDRLAFAQEKKKLEKLEKKKAKDALKKRKDIDSEGMAKKSEPGELLREGGSSDEEKKKAKKKARKELEGKKEMAPGINMTMPDLSSLNAPKSKAVASLYHENGKGENKGNYLTKGTFNRFAP